jgi:DNA-binding helix-hairpin-helix protein with protein kinase domain
VVAKVYHQPTDAHGRKLTAMFANQPQDPLATQEHVSVAWPVDLVSIWQAGRFTHGINPLFRGNTPVANAPGSA